MTFPPSVIGFSAYPPSVVALRLPFSLFFIVLVLSYLLRVPMVVDDGVLRLCEVKNSLLAPFREEFHLNHLLLRQRRPRNNKSWHLQVYPVHFLDSEIVK